MRLSKLSMKYIKNAQFGIHSRVDVWCRYHLLFSILYLLIFINIKILLILFYSAFIDAEVKMTGAKNVQSLRNSCVVVGVYTKVFAVQWLLPPFLWQLHRRHWWEESNQAYALNSKAKRQICTKMKTPWRLQPTGRPRCQSCELLTASILAISPSSVKLGLNSGRGQCCRNFYQLAQRLRCRVMERYVYESYQDERNMENDLQNEIQRQKYWCCCWCFSQYSKASQVNLSLEWNRVGRNQWDDGQATCETCLSQEN